MQPHAILEIAIYLVAQYKIQHVKRLVISDAALTNCKRDLAFVVGGKNGKCDREGFARHLGLLSQKLHATIEKTNAMCNGKHPQNSEEVHPEGQMKPRHCTRRRRAQNVRAVPV